MSLLFRALPPEKRANPYSPPKWSEVSNGYSTHGSRDAMKLAVFFRCVDILAANVASLPFKAYRRNGVRRDEVRSKLIDTPHPTITQWDWVYMLMQSLCTTGNAFGYVTSRTESGHPASILPVHPSSVRIDPEKGSWDEPGYEISGKPVDTDDVLHIKAYPVPGSPVGLSPIEHLASTLDLAFSAESYGLRWFKDSANPSGVLSSDENLTESQVKREMKRWVQTHGRGNRYPAILGGGLKWQSISITPEESQFLLTRAQQRSDIAMFFGIPPHMIGDTEKTSSWGQGVAEQTLGFQKFTFARYVVSIEQALDPLLPGKQFCKFNMDALLRPDPESRARIDKMRVESGQLSPDEARAHEDLPPIVGYPGNIYLQPKAHVPLGWKPEDETNTPPPDGEMGDTNDSP